VNARRTIRLARAIFATSPLVALVTLLAVSAPGCGLQGEGERCNLKNGDVDCTEGLKCTSALDLGGQSDICCPTTASDNVACIPGGLGTSSSSGSATSSSAATTTSSAASTGAGGTGGAGGAGVGGAGGAGQGGAGGG